MEQLLASFSAYLSVIGYQPGTQSAIRGCVRELVAYGGYTDVESIFPEDIARFYAWLHERPLKRGEGALSGMMISHYVYSLKVFFGWLQASSYIVENPISGIVFGRPQYQPREPLSAAEIQGLFDAAATGREQALLHVFYSCGLRRTEGAMLRLSDVHFKERLLYVRSGKGERRRVVPLTGRVSAALQDYVTQERSRDRHSEAAFLLHATGKAMSGSDCLKLLKTLLAKAGLPDHITLHHLRHSIATHLLQGGMKAEQVRDFLGHRHLECTQIYATNSPDQILLL